MKKIYTLLALTLLFAANSFSQCVPTAVYTTSAWGESSNPTVPYNGYVCDGHDSLVARTDGGWYFFDGDGFFVKLISGAQYRIAIDSIATSASITVSDSLGANGAVIPGAFAPSASTYNSLLFTAPYTGQFYIVVNENGTCGGAGTSNLSTGSVKLLSQANCPVVAAVFNDTICAATTIVLGTVYSGDNTGADATDPLDADVIAAGYACSTPNNTLWYSFTPAVTGNYDIASSSPTGGLDMWIGFFSGTSTCSDPLTYINCIKGTGVGATATTMVQMNVGNTYYFMIDGFSGSVGAYTFSIDQNLSAFPINDTICGATVMTLGAVYSDDNTIAAPTDPMDAAVLATGFNCSSPNNTLWYTFTPSASDNYIVSTSTQAGTGLNGWIVVLEGANCTSPLTLVSTVCSNIWQPGASLEDTLTLTAGTQYFFMVDGYAGAVGDFTITINPQPNGIKSINATKNIEVFPNPSTGLISVTTITSSTDLVVNNAVGQVVFTEAKLNAGKHTIDLSNLPQGIYTVKAISGNTVENKKITISK